MHDIIHMMVEKTSIFFLDLFRAAKSKREMITTFLALLELIKQKVVVVKQSQAFADIEVIRCMDEVKPVSEGNGPRPLT
jgi:segregation and condensation protein A